MIDQHITQFFCHHPPLHTLYVGLSGGMDSVALLHALRQYHTKHANNLKLIALHVHHNLQTQADEWADFCRQLCADWHIEFHCQHVQIEKKNIGIEAAARQARYAAFAQQIGHGSIALAHHADDQIETLLLAVLRGGGLRAFAAMPETRLSGSLNVLRPLLNVSRNTIQDYVQQHQLPHIHDPSNNNTQFLRNWVRHNLLPHMTQRVPSVAQHILQSITVLQDELSIVDRKLDEIWQDVYCGHFLARHHFNRLHAAEQKAILLKFCQEKQLGSPAQNNLNYFVDYLQNHPVGSATWSLPHGEIWAYRQQLWAWHNTQQKQLLLDTQPFSGCLKHAHALHFVPHSYGLPDLSANAVVRPHCKTDRIHTHAGHKTVGKILQDAHIPTPLRPNWLVVEQNGMCVAVSNLVVCRSVAVANGWLPEWALTQSFLTR